MSSPLKVGDAVTLPTDRPAWYSGYGANPQRVIRAGEPLTVTHVDVPPVRGRTRYAVARTADGWQIDIPGGDA